MQDYYAYLDSLGIKATQYRIGDLETDGHVHDFYLRDDLPRATSTGHIGTGLSGYHEHSIEKGADGLVCLAAGSPSHTHTVFTVVKQPTYPDYD